jgi:hypothetical protein
VIVVGSKAQDSILLSDAKRKGISVKKKRPALSFCGGRKAEE